MIERQIVEICDGLYAGLSRLQSEPARGGGFVADCQARGIIDPIENRVVAPHYATSHFAWGALLRHRRLGDSKALENGLQAFEFTFKTSTDPAQWTKDFHWDFKNLALAECLQLLKGILKPCEWDACHSSLIGLPRSRGLATNWFAMRSLAFAYTSDRSPRRALRSLCHLLPVLLALRPDGCIDDFLWLSRPIQYSAYTACLLERHPFLPRRIKRRIVLRSASFLCRHILPDGQFNHRGRGHEQIFGYAAAIYLLMAAAEMEDDSTALLARLRRVAEHLGRFQGPDGLLPLILNSPRLPPRWGYYDYHYLSVYNAFTLAWLEAALSRGRKASGDHSADCPRESARLQSPCIWVSRWSGTAVATAPRYGYLATRGESRYSADAGISPHVIWCGQGRRLFACPGGPTAGRHGARHRQADVSSNYLSPLFRPLGEEKWVGPSQGRPLGMKRIGGSLQFRYRRGVLEFQRQLRFLPNEIQVADRVRFRQEAEGQLRIFNLPLLEELDWRQEGSSLVVSQGRDLVVTMHLGEDAGPLAVSDQVTENPLGRCRCLFIPAVQGRFGKGCELQMAWSLIFPN